LTVSYNNGTFLCPSSTLNEIIYNGVYDMYCDDDGLVRVITDGFSWIWISQWSWCDVIPTANDPVLEALANYTTFGDATLDCNTDDYGTVTDCAQNSVDFPIPVQIFDVGGSIGFEPLDTQGNFLPDCPTVTDVQPIVTNTATCTGTSVSYYSTIYYTVTAS